MIVRVTAFPLFLLLMLIMWRCNSFGINRFSVLSYSRFGLSLSAKGFGCEEFRYSGKIKPGNVSPKRFVPSHIAKPDYINVAIDSNEDKFGKMVPLEKMSKASRIAREVLDEAIAVVKPGITTDFIDQIVHEATISRNSYPSPLDYCGFPKSCCTSVNEVLCHGIPDSYCLKDGDIINVDITVFHDGVHGDCSETILVGNVDSSITKMVYVSYIALQRAISVCRPGVPFYEIGNCIDSVVSKYGYSIAPEFVGHGIGEEFHCRPHIFHTKNSFFENGVMKQGQTFTIEPIICMKSPENIVWPDKWTHATKDGLPTAQFEHTIYIHSHGAEILTKRFVKGEIFPPSLLAVVAPGMNKCCEVPITWEVAKQAVLTSTLAVLGRNASQLEVYDNTMRLVKQEWVSTKDYILYTKFDFPFDTIDIQDSNSPDRLPATKKYVKPYVLPSPRIVVKPNDFPYYFEKGIKHFIVWKIGDKITQAEADEYGEKLSKEYSAIDWLSFINPPSLKSIPEIDHAHVLLKVQN